MKDADLLELCSKVMRATREANTITLCGEVVRRVAAGNFPEPAPRVSRAGYMREYMRVWRLKDKAKKAAAIEPNPFE